MSETEPEPSLEEADVKMKETAEEEQEEAGVEDEDVKDNWDDEDDDNVKDNWWDASSDEEPEEG